MATYLYECEGCHEQREIVHGMTETPRIECELCLGDMHKVMHPAYSGMTRKTSDGELSDWENTKFR